MQKKTKRHAPPSSKTSQLATHQRPKSFASTLPSDEELAETGVYGMVQDVKETRAKADQRRHDSLNRELALCFHAALYIATYKGAWEDFCKAAKIETERSPDDCDVLYAVLLEYTGKSRDGQKKASRYKRALEAHMARRATAAQVYTSLKKGGVDKLLRERSGSDGSVTKTMGDPKPIRFTGAGTRITTLKAGDRQTVIITPKESARYAIKVVKGPYVPPRAKK